jgi:phosphate transport system protein
MSRRTYQRSLTAGQHGRDATRAQVVEAIDRTAPKTKTELAETVGLSEQYLSELLQELKTENVIKKSYVVDDSALYESSERISTLSDSGSETEHYGTAVMKLLDRLESATTQQYDAARAAFMNEEVDPSAATLESLTNERYSAVLSELKSYTLTTDWPGNRIASDLSTIATNLEIVGDRACFIADVVEAEEMAATGIVSDRMADIFASGTQINEYFCQIMFDCELAVHEQLRETEETVHRDLNELFELVTAYDPEIYGYLASITRALERAIYYWVDAAELAVQLHSGLRPDHTEI